MFLVPILASFGAGYGLCWLSSSSSSVPSSTSPPQSASLSSSSPTKLITKTFHEELAERVEAEYKRREYQRSKIPPPGSELKLIAKADSFLKRQLEAKFRNALPSVNPPLPPVPSHSLSQTDPCIADETRRLPSASPLFRGG